MLEQVVTSNSWSLILRTSPRSIRSFDNYVWCQSRFGLCLKVHCPKTFFGMLRTFRTVFLHMDGTLPFASRFFCMTMHEVCNGRARVGRRRRSVVTGTRGHKTHRV